MIICRRKKLCRQVFYPRLNDSVGQALLFFHAATVRAMPVAAAMVLLVQVIAIFIITTVMMHAHGCRMAAVQLIKNMPAISVKILCMDIAKNLLQPIAIGLLACSRAAHDLLFINASKGDTMAARLDCCKCRYTMVVLRLLCPSNSLMVCKSQPASSKCVAKECRSVWAE